APCVVSPHGRPGAPTRPPFGVCTFVPQRRRPASACTACAGTSPRSARLPMRASDPMVVSALSTDLYELTMVGGYFVKGLSAPATFDLFVRYLPPTRNYLVACGIEQALDFLESLHFTAAEIRILRA